MTSHEGKGTSFDRPHGSVFKTLFRLTRRKPSKKYWPFVLRIHRWISRTRNQLGGKRIHVIKSFDWYTLNYRLPKTPVMWGWSTYVADKSHIASGLSHMQIPMSGGLNHANYMWLCLESDFPHGTCTWAPIQYHTKRLEDLYNKISRCSSCGIGYLKLTIFGRVTPYGDRDLCQHWRRSWACCLTFITWINVDLSPVRSSDIQFLKWWQLVSMTTSLFQYYA